MAGAGSRLTKLTKLTKLGCARIGLASVRGTPLVLPLTLSLTPGWHALGWLASEVLPLTPTLTLTPGWHALGWLPLRCSTIPAE